MSVSPDPLTTEAGNALEAAANQAGAARSERIVGRLEAVSGLTATAVGLPVARGTGCTIQTRDGRRCAAEVAALRAGVAVLSLVDDASGIAPGDSVECDPTPPVARVGPDLLGRVIDARGRALDLDRIPEPPVLTQSVPLYRTAPSAMTRRRIDAPLGLGIRAVDALLTVGLGQRVGIFAGTGVGKSVLMGMICRHTQADVNVIALLGERGREVLDFVERDLGPEGLARSVVVVTTSDESPALRVRAAFTATAIAEYFRDCGLNVMLMVDSLTRMAMAHRQIGVAAGEPPAAKGYPPSTFALLPQLLERAGRTQRGSITGIYTVLVEGDQLDDPLADAVRGILDGHLWLSRKLANRGHYPAIDVLNSISRVADDVTAPEQRETARRVREVIAVWEDIEDLVSIGAYAQGSNPQYDLALQTRDVVRGFLQQACDSGAPFERNIADLRQLGEALERTAQRLDRGAARKQS